MTLILLALRDLKSGLWKPPMAVANIPAALRDLADMMGDANNKEDWARHPEDFELYNIGSYNTMNGAIAGNDDPAHLCTMVNLKR
jgi:hypothetical protein